MYFHKLSLPKSSAISLIDTTIPQMPAIVPIADITQLNVLLVYDDSISEKL